MLRSVHRCVSCSFLAVVLLMSGCRTPKGGGRKDPTPTPTPEPVAAYSFRRAPTGTPITDFERLAGWTVSAESGTATLEKRSDQAVWGNYAAKIQYTPSPDGESKVILTPDIPLPVRSPFNTLLIWIWHEGAKGMRDDHVFRVVGRDAQAVQRSWDLAYTPEDGWQMLHARDTTEVPWPAQIDRFEWILPRTAEGVQTLSLDSLSMYQEVVGRIPQWIDYVRPYQYAPAFAPVRNNSVQLDFPVSGHAFRPREASVRSLTSSEQVTDQTYRFRYKNEKNQYTYQVSATEGFPVIRAWAGEEKGASVIQWKGVHVDTGAVMPELRYARLRDGKLWLQYTEGLSFEISLHGQTLQLDTHSLSEAVTRFHLGKISVEGRRIPRILNVPFLRLSEEVRWPVFTWQDRGRLQLAVCFPDWWYSMAASYTERSTDNESGDLDLGSMNYPVRWRGSRNVFRERVYFTIGSELMEVLPSPAHPEAMYKEDLTRKIWIDEVNEYVNLTEMILHTNGLESTGVWNPAERGKGWVTSLLSIHPKDETWDPSMVSRTSAGDWRPHPTTGFQIKPGRLDAVDVFERIGTEDPQTFVYENGIFSYPPWRFTDYDVRLPGAATFTQSWAEIGAFLQQTAAETGLPVLGRGGAGLFWGGLVAGVVPEFPLGIEEMHPFLPHFSWKNLHEVMVVMGLGTLQDFVLPGEVDPKESVLVDRMLAAQIAYGATGRLPPIQDPDLRLKALRLQEVLHPVLSRQTAERIAYWDGERLVNVVEAMQSGRLVDSQLYIRLQDTTEIWVNGSFTESWEVRVDAELRTLPPFGFVVRGPDVYALQAISDQRNRYCILQSADRIWIHSPTKPVEREGFKVQGSVQIQKRRNPEAVFLEIRDWQGQIEFTGAQLGFDTVGTVVAKDEQGRQVSDATLTGEKGTWTLTSSEDLYSVEIYPTVRGAEGKFVP